MMAAYSYLCPACGSTETVRSPIAVGPPVEVWCPSCEDRGPTVAMKRDYQADNAGLGNVSELRKSREAGGTDGAKALFLPDNKDFAGPGDPDGTKGMRDWREGHAPRDTNKRPAWPGHVERRAF